MKTPIDFDAHYRRQIRRVIAGSLAVIALVFAFGWQAFSRYQATQEIWGEYNHRAAAIGTSMLHVRRLIGYGGFIHDFKNLVLRRDVARYQQPIEENLAGLKKELDHLQSLLILPENHAHVETIRATILEYERVYQQVFPLVAAGKSSAEIDAVVKVDDEPAKAALAGLLQRVEQRTHGVEIAARSSYEQARNFMLLGGMLVFVALLIAGSLMISHLKRIAAAHAKAHRLQTRLDLLLDTSPDPMLSVATDGRIVRSNLMAERFFGYTQDTLLGMAVEDLIPERFRNRHASQRAGYFTDPHHRPMGGEMKLKALTSDGREPNVEISLSHSGERAERLATITIRDVTEREKQRIELEKAHQATATALLRERALQDTLVQTEKMAALGGLVAGVAHEINTPVGVALSAATHLQGETEKTAQTYAAGDLTEDGLADYFTTARQAAQLMTLNSQRASDLIHSFKQVAVDQTGGERRRFDLAIYIDEVLLSLRPRLKKSSVTVGLDCPAGIVMDSLPGALSQVLTNLIVNSLAHAFAPEQAGHVTLTVRTPDDETVELVYRDDGKGIPAELHARIFDPFFTTLRSAGGSGLGLHIVYNIIHQTLKGTLAFDSAPGRGVCFTLRLPRQLPEGNAT